MTRNRGIARLRNAIALVGVLLLAGCTDNIGIGTGGTFVVAVGQEQYRVRIESAFMATQARRMMMRVEDQKVIFGELERGDGGFNAGHAWHIKPGTIQFANDANDQCNGRPSDVDADIDHWVDTIKQFCPSLGQFVSEVGRL